MSAHVPWTRLAATLSLVVVLSGCAGPAASDTGKPTDSATLEDAEVRGEASTVERVVDGDTVDVILHGETVRVRLLNIDTPETKHPDEMVERLGPEASEYLEELLPPGEVVGLEHDKAKKDRYGRTLAGVFLDDGRLVNAEIAREGLGVPVAYIPNVKFLPPVEEAYAEAKAKKRGLFDPAAECTVPSQVQAAAEGPEQADPSTLQEPAAQAAQDLLDDIDAIDMAAYPFVAKIEDSPSIAKKIRTLRNDIEDIDSGKHRKESTPESDGDSSSSSSGAEGDRPQAEARADSQADRLPTGGGSEAVAPEPAPESEPEAAVPAPVEAVPELPEAPAPVVPDNPAPAVPLEQERADPMPKSDPQPAPNVAEEAPPGYVRDIPGYTGPRCYAPGGKFYKPC